jgi:predicted glutamine amidotransferase
MCRLTAYIGPEIPIENIVVKPQHSLLVQSREASESKSTVNGDGFGLAWYQAKTEPGLYREVLPAWSDSNLSSLCRLVQSRLFLAHVRASTMTESIRTNCHPFTFENWSFMHNGQIGHFEDLKRELEASLSDTLYQQRRGTTDSEMFFLLLLNEGLDDNPLEAVRRVINKLIDVSTRRNLEPFLRLSCVFSDGITLAGFRYASDQFSPTLYLSKSLDNGGTCLASEPLEGDSHNWQTVACGTYIEITPDGHQQHALNLSGCCATARGHMSSCAA